MTERLVQCVKLGKELPGLARPPYRNELGQRLFENVSAEAWKQWLGDSVKFVNTYRVDLASPEGQKFMFKQCAIYFGFEQGEVAQTAWTPRQDEHGHDHAGHDHHGHDHGKKDG
jgi:Fe-S cluster biosynthesis and repair protein YggX